MGSQQLTDDPPVVDVIDAHEDDGIIPRYPEFPEIGNVEDAQFQELVARAHGGVRIEEAVGQMLEEVGLAPLDPQVVELNLGMGPDMGGGSLEGCRVVVLVGQEKDRLTG